MAKASSRKKTFLIYEKTLAEVTTITRVEAPTRKEAIARFDAGAGEYLGLVHGDNRETLSIEPLEDKKPNFSSAAHAPRYTVKELIEAIRELTENRFQLDLHPDDKAMIVDAVKKAKDFA